MRTRLLSLLQKEGKFIEVESSPLNGLKVGQGNKGLV